MAITAEEILLNLKNNEYAPVYFLQGEEPFMIDQITSYIEKHAIPEEARSFNLMVMYGKDVKVNEILTAARRFPMMSDRQVVIVKEAQEVSDLKTENGQNLLIHYLENPVLSTILVFSHKYKKVDGRSALSKKLAATTVLLNTKKLYDNQIPTWIQKYAEGYGRTVSPHVAQIMADHTGNDLERIANEIIKIVEALPDSSTISEEMVYKYVGINKDYNNFEMIRAVLLKDRLRANQIIKYFESNPRKNPIIPLLALMLSAFNKLLVLHQFKNENDRTLASKIKVSPYFIKEYKIGSSNYSLQKVQESIQDIHQSDLMSKGINSPTITESQILRELIFKILN